MQVMQLLMLLGQQQVSARPVATATNRKLATSAVLLPVHQYLSASLGSLSSWIEKIVAATSGSRLRQVGCHATVGCSKLKLSKRADLKI